MHAGLSSPSTLSTHENTDPFLNSFPLLWQTDSLTKCHLRQFSEQAGQEAARFTMPGMEDRCRIVGLDDYHDDKLKLAIGKAPPPVPTG